VPTKLSAVLVLPAVAFLAIAGVQINSSVSNAGQLDQFARGVQVGRQLTALVHLLQSERDHTAGVLARASHGGPGDPVTIGAELAADYSSTDSAIADFSRAAKPLQSVPSFANASPTLGNDFQQLRLVREGVKNRWLRQAAIFDQYSTMIQHLFELVPVRSDVGGDAESAQNVSSLLDLAQAKELTSQLRGRIFAACAAGTFSPDDFETFAEIQARQVAAIQRFRSQAGAQHLARYDETLRGAAVSSVARLQETVIGRARGTVVNIPAEDWWRSSTQELELIRYVEQLILEDAVQGAAGRSSAERRNAFIAISIIVLIMLLALLLSWMIGRSMARSLRQLRTQALDVAQHRLPEAIQRLRNLPRGETVTVDTTTRVRSTDEIGEVADAFTAVHRSAVSLAVEQAVMRRNVNSMFINLARRSQTLVERQLQLLDQLEAAETDPEQLANLFRLDHLATRMRRNDENLLVLAGSEATRRWAQPVSLSAVTLAAMAEIEQYARIRHDVSNDVFIVGHAVADVVHLLAELLENATTFSPPDTVVNVAGWPSSNGKEATIIIEDHGLGMTQSGLLEANDRVVGPVAIDVAASERMGLVVVGHLATRHGVHVRLTGSDDGVVAYATLPARLLAPAPDGGGLYGGATGRLTNVTRLPIAAGSADTSMDDTSVIEVPYRSSATAGSPPRPPSSDDDTTIIPAIPAVAAPPLPSLPVRPTNAPGPVAGRPVSGMPVSGVPVSGVPVSGVPVSGIPVSGVPVSGVPVSGVPVSGVPVSGVPVSGTPVSATPVSGRPVSAMPVSGMPVSGMPVSGMPVSGAPASGPPASRPATAGRPATNGRPAAPVRPGPNRAEDIIGAAARGNAPTAKGTRWWSRGGGSDMPAGVPAAPVQRTPVTAGTSGVGLPIRVPMAQLPADTAQKAPATRPIAVMHGEPDPAEVSSMLKRFYSGVHRAANEDDVPTVPITDHQGARRDPEPTST
jgi:methyl-accepting chemotaxis protein